MTAMLMTPSGKSSRSGGRKPERALGIYMQEHGNNPRGLPGSAPPSFGSQCRLVPSGETKLADKRQDILCLGFPSTTWRSQNCGPREVLQPRGCEEG